MNRQQAEHILDAYTLLCVHSSHKDASDSLREVILDAMTENRTSGITVTPGITLPTTKPFTTPYYQTICKTEVGA